MYKFFKLSVIASLIASLNFFMSGVPTLAATTTVSATVTAGTLTITSDTSAAFDNVSVTSSSQSTQARVLSVVPADLRGTGAGWTASVTSTNLGLNFSGSTTLANLRRTVTGAMSDGISAAAGVYDGQNCVTAYSGTGAVNCGEVKIVVKTVSGSPAKPATVDLYKPSDLTTAETANATVTSNQVTFHGVTLTFGSTTAYAVNDEFRLRVDAFPYTSLTDQVMAMSGSGGSSTTGLLGTGGSAFSNGDASSAAFTGSNATSASHTYMQAPVNTGMGTYNSQDSLTQTVHANPVTGAYQLTLTYTIA